MSPDYSEHNPNRKQAYKRDNYTCQNCGRQGGPRGHYELHAHHVVPKSDGGSDELKNLQTLCKGCHNAIHQDGKTAPNDERELDLGLNKEPFEKCPICQSDRIKVEFHEQKIHCPNCRTLLEPDVRDDGPSIIPKEITNWIVTYSNYDINGTSMDYLAWKKVEEDELDNICELDRYTELSDDYHNNLTQSVYKMFVAVIVIMILGFATGNIIWGFIGVIVTIAVWIMWILNYQHEIEPSG